ncbi:type II secretion system F family protein [Dehalobacterium formicoaceticum]|uniref:Type II secretion system F family protein n=1 Tax=Dehalobacterium formicoaceticum TaxID=51515 RepID=A0ABT1Y783_9FIRM|nr:type II secretion system F family protein [Dehalobacterium formicoaceticum]MCR6546757.1 type II secretion system F family protein [Dehalobacterium formicoaceticum]
MAEYAYKVRDMGGRVITGTMKAENERIVVEELRNRDYLIVDVAEKTVRNFNIKLPKLESSVKAKDLAMFCRQLSTLMNAGVPLVNCIRILQEQTEKGVLKDALQEVVSHLEEGNSLAQSLRPYPKVFPDIFVNMVETGELSGTIDEVMERLAINYEREHDIREKVKSSMTYPLVILIVAVLGMSIMLIFIIPMLVGMLIENGAELPLITRIVLGASEFTKNYWYLILLIFIGLYYGTKQAFKKKNVREAFDRFLLKMPVFGELIQIYIVSRFSRTLGSMLRSGVPIVEALGTVQRTVGNLAVSREVDMAKESILRGKGIAEPLKYSQVFPSMVVNMIAVGEESGALDTMLEKVAVFYDREVDTRLDRLASLVEPLLIVGLGVVLGFMIIAMMLPILDITSGSTI